MSMENHQTYTPEKYGQPSGFPAQCDKLSQEDLAILEQYTAVERNLLYRR